MKSALVISIATWLCFAASAADGMPTDTAVVSTANHATDRERILRIENGLLPAILVKGPKLLLTVSDGRLFPQTDPLGPEPLELYSESDTQLFTAQGFSVTFHRNDERIITKLTLRAGQDLEATKIP